MSKKKQLLTFSNSDITFFYNTQNLRVLNLNLKSMDVEVVEEESKKMKKMPFAHLPKEIKKQLRPL